MAAKAVSLCFASLFVAAAFATTVHATQPGCPGTFVINGEFIIPIFEFYASQNIWQVGSIKPVDYSTSVGLLSYALDVYGGSLVCKNFGTVATVAYTVQLLDLEGTLSEQICSYQARGGASGQGDPHFQGFDGSLFDFNGMAGEAYELLSTADTLVNIQMIKRGTMTGSDGQRFLLPQFNGTATWIGAVAVVQGGLQVTVSKSEQEVIAVKVNDQELTLGSEARSPAMNVSFQKQAFPGSDFGHWEGIPTVIIAVQEFTVKVGMPPSFSQRLDVAVSRNLDIIPQAEGIIGRTISNMFTGHSIDADVTDSVWIEDGGNKMTHSEILNERLTAAYRTSSLYANDAAKTCYAAESASKTPDAQSFQIMLSSEAVSSTPVSHRRLLMS